MFRLIFLTLAALVGAMLIWGTEDPSIASLEVTESVIAPLEVAAPDDGNEEVVAPVEEVVTPVEEEEPIAVEQALPEQEVAVTQLNQIDTSAPAPASNLIVVEANDAPEGTVIEAVTAALEAEEDPTVSETPAPDPIVLVVTGGRVNLREGPSTSSTIVGKLNRGEATELIANLDNGWMHIRHLTSGREGYMSGDFLKPASE